MFLKSSRNITGGIKPRGSLRAMRRLFRRRAEKAGMAPGTLVAPPDLPPQTPEMQVCNYSEQGANEAEFSVPTEAIRYVQDSAFTWMNIDNALDVKLVQEIGDSFGVGPLILEDIMNRDHRPKLEDRGDVIFVTVQDLEFGDAGFEVLAHQVSILLRANVVITLNETRVQPFERVRDRIRRGGPRLTKLGPGYLLVALLDVVVDRYFAVLDQLGDGIGEVETNIAERPSASALESIHAFQTELVLLRRWIAPVREIVAELRRSESLLIPEEVQPYVRDLHDNVIDAIDAVQTYREMIANLLSGYHSALGTQLNSVMRVLTIVATIFIPLTFLAGIYGMNFEHMPELGWVYAYPTLIGVMIVLTAGMVAWLRLRRWL